MERFVKSIQATNLPYTQNAQLNAGLFCILPGRDPAPSKRVRHNLAHARSAKRQIMSLRQAQLASSP